MKRILPLALLLLTACDVTSPEDEEEPEPTLVWTDIRAWTGNGDRTTEQFPVASSQWRIIMSSQATHPDFGILVIFAYPAGETVSYVGTASLEGTRTDTTYVQQGRGNFYLDVLAANTNWTVRVQDQRPES